MSMNDLLPPNKTGLEAAVSDVTDRALDHPIRDMWNPDECPEKFLPWLAWALSVDDWDANWTAAQKRQAIKSAIPIHWVKGTVGAVRRAIEVFGAGVNIVEWWQQAPKGTPHTFTVTIAIGGGTVATGEVLDRMSQAIDRVKPARSHYTITAAQQGLADVGIAAVVWPMQILMGEAELI